MREGAVVLLPLTQADGKVKPRPAVALRQLPGFGDWLVCGISTQLHQLVSGFDQQVSVKDSDFSLSGLTEPSIIRLASCSQFGSRPYGQDWRHFCRTPPPASYKSFAILGTVSE